MELQPGISELLRDARTQKMWLWERFHDLWFSPDELEAEMKNGLFRLGPDRFKFRDPRAEIEFRREKAAKDYEDLAQFIARVEASGISLENEMTV